MSRHTCRLGPHVCSQTSQQWKKSVGGHAPVGSMPCSSEMTSQNLEPIWLPHWPAWRWTISRMVANMGQTLTVGSGKWRGAPRTVGWSQSCTARHGWDVAFPRPPSVVKEMGSEASEHKRSVQTRGSCSVPGLGHRGFRLHRSLSDGIVPAQNAGACVFHFVPLRCESPKHKNTRHNGRHANASQLANAWARPSQLLFYFLPNDQVPWVP